MTKCNKKNRKAKICILFTVFTTSPRPPSTTLSEHTNMSFRSVLRINLANPDPDQFFFLNNGQSSEQSFI
jgi:hypothetical protein